MERRGEIGEETGDASSPRPDENVADEIGEEVGVVYQDAQERRTGEEWERRDRNRWELNPSSSEDESLRNARGERDEASEPGELAETGAVEREDAQRDPGEAPPRNASGAERRAAKAGPDHR